MNRAPVPLGAIILAGCALAVALVVGAMYLAWSALAGATSAAWRRERLPRWRSNLDREGAQFSGASSRTVRSGTAPEEAL